MNDSAATPSQCPHCGAVLPADAPEGLCPRCLASLHVAPETAFTDAEAASAHSPLSTEELAPHFPQLEILECLGRGGMGVVYKARQKSLNRIVALKLLAPERVRDGKFAERFAYEARALAALNHPHIVTVYDFGEAGGFYYLLMEFVDGVNLRQAMKAGRFTPEQALAIVPPVCEALQYAHEHGIVHRDIKPENLLLDKEGRVKIADFGIAKLIGERTSQSHTSRASDQSHSSDPTQSGVTLGTPTYMAPEQRDTPAGVDHRADIYSLGVVLYELLTGELPAEKLRPPSSHPGGIRIDVRLDEVVLRALEKEPELRYQTAADFRTHVETIAATAIHPSGSAGGKGRNSLIWIGGAIASALALIALAMNLSATSRIRARAEWKNGRAEGESSVKPAVEAPPLVLCTQAYVGDLGVHLEGLGSVLPPASSSERQDNNRVPISFSIPESYVQQVFPKLQSKQPLPVEAYDSQRIKVGEGFLTAMNNQIDVETGTIQCRAVITTNGDAVLLPNKFLSVRMLLETKRSITLLPAGAVRQNGQRSVVYLVAQNRRVTIRPVTSGGSDSGVTEITNGVSPGETVVLDPPESLKEGSVIRCKSAPLISSETAMKGIAQSQPPADNLSSRDTGVSSERAPVTPRSNVIASQDPSPVSTEPPEPTPAESEIARPAPASASATPATTQALQREALLIQLRQATEAARLREVEYRAGTGDYSAFLAAKEKMDLLRTQIDGDAARMTSIRLETARQQAAIVEARYRAGVADQSEVLAAKEKVDVLEAETHGDTVQAAAVRLSAAEGQLRITEVRSKAGEIPFLDLEAARNAVELRRAELRDAKAAQSDAPSFGQVIECSVNDIADTAVNCFIDLDSGQLLSVPDSIAATLRTDPSAGEREAIAWATSHHADAMARAPIAKGGAASCGLRRLDMLVIRMDNESWDKFTPSQVDVRLKNARSEFSKAEPEMTADGKHQFPATWIFQTREGGRGILQITGRIESPRGVKLRYKLVTGAKPHGG